MSQHLLTDSTFNLSVPNQPCFFIWELGCFTSHSHSSSFFIRSSANYFLCLSSLAYLSKYFKTKSTGNFLGDFDNLESRNKNYVFQNIFANFLMLQNQQKSFCMTQKLINVRFSKDFPSIFHQNVKVVNKVLV